MRRQDHPVTREEAAEAGRVSRSLAAFHLDKLVSAGLLQARYAAPAGPRGRGRTPKVYEPAPGRVTLSIPERRYDLMGEILADAVDEHPTDAQAAALRLARERGAQTGREAGEADLTDVLAALGFEPASASRPGQSDAATAAGHGESHEIVLRNCPFHRLAVRHTALVCGLNHAFLGGLLDGMGRVDLDARLEPAEGACCVRIATGESG